MLKMLIKRELDIVIDTDMPDLDDNINTGDIHERAIYLGIYDSKENYIEVTEEEYQEWLHRDVEENQATEEDLYNALAELGVKEDD